MGVTYALLSNSDVVSNLKSLKLIDKHKNIMFSKENLFNAKYYKHKLMLIDEFYLESDRREPMSSNNKMWSYFAQMSRKYPLSDIIFIAQRLNLFDSRILEMFDFLIEAYNNEYDKCFEYKVLKTNTMKQGSFIIKYKNATPIFEHFDSKEIPFSHKLDKMMFVNMLPKNRKKLAIKISNDIKNEYPDYDKKFTALLDIEAYCINKDIQHDANLRKQIKFMLKT